MARQQSLHLAVEVGCAAKQSGTQSVELFLLQEQVGAHLAVEQLDRGHGEVESLALAPVRVLEIGVGPSDLGVGDGQIDVGRRQLVIGLGLHGEHRRGAGQGDQHRGGERGDGCAVMAPPAAGTAGERLAPGGDLFVRHPAIDVAGQSPGRGVTVSRLESHRLQAHRLEGTVDRGVERRGGRKSPVCTARSTSATSPVSGGFPVNSE